MAKCVCDERLRYTTLIQHIGCLITDTDLIGTVEHPVTGLHESCDSMKIKFIDHMRSYQQVNKNNISFVVIEYRLKSS